MNNGREATGAQGETRRGGKPLGNEDAAQIKEALGRLYKKVGELELTQKTEREEDRKELATWAETNLIQTELLRRSIETIERLTRTLGERENYWEECGRSSKRLLEALKAASAPSGSTPTAIQGKMLSRDPDIQNLQRLLLILEEMPSHLRRTRIEQMHRAMNGETIHPNLPAPSTSSAEPTSPWPRAWRSAALAFAAALSVIICLETFPPVPEAALGALRDIKTRVNWTNAKLSRIETGLKGRAR